MISTKLQPAFCLAEGTGLHQAYGIAYGALVVFVVGMIFLALVDEFTVNRVFLFQRTVTVIVLSPLLLETTPMRSLRRLRFSSIVRCLFVVKFAHAELGLNACYHAAVGGELGGVVQRAHGMIHTSLQIFFLHLCKRSVRSAVAISRFLLSS